MSDTLLPLFDPPGGPCFVSEVCLSFGCITCGTILSFRRDWDLSITLDFECATCGATYLIPITMLRKGNVDAHP
jgi:hypothetical protein